MKAFKPDGSRWFSRTTVEIMTEWLEDPDLLLWLGSARSFRPLAAPLMTVIADAITDATLEALERAELETLQRDPQLRALCRNPRIRALVFGGGIDEYLRELFHPSN